MKECELELTQKGDMVARLQVKASQIGKLLQSLETKSHADAADRKTGPVLSKQRSESGPPVKKPHYIDPIPPFNANKIRKSPSASLSSASTSAKPNIATTPTATATTTISTSLAAATINETDKLEQSK